MKQILLLPALVSLALAAAARAAEPQAKPEARQPATAAENQPADDPEHKPADSQPPKQTPPDPLPAPTGVPVIDSITPNWTTLGKTAKVVIRGKSFLPGPEGRSRLFVDRNEVASAEVVSETEIRALLPAREKPGWAIVEVRNPDGQSASLAKGFHHGPIPKGFFGSLAARAGAFYDRFQMGGTIMWFILALSIAGLAWFIHCLTYLRPLVLMPAGLKAELADQLRRGELAKAKVTCERSNCPLGRVALAGIRQAGQAPEKIAEAVEAAGSRESAHLFQKISYLSNIGVISPMLGLFGTVLGMILVFDTMANQEGAHHIILGAGVSKALYTTAFGLIVGIPAMCAYYYLRGRAIKLVTILEEHSEDLIASLVKGSKAPGS